MSRILADLRYLSSHEWIRIEGDGTATIGITDHAQGLLGDIVFVELPDVGDEFSAGEEAAVVESVKAASDVYCPLSGTVIEVNEVLENAPETVNADPYHDGWFFRIRLSDTTEVESLLDAEGYTEVCESEAEDH